MFGIKKAVVCLAFISTVGFLTAPAFASLLNTGTAYNDGITVWKGSTNFAANTNPDMYGHVDWIVYAPGQFPLSFVGYSPNPNYYTYVYQMNADGSDAVSNYTVMVNNDAYDIGSFHESGNVEGDSPFYMELAPYEYAAWDFNGILQGTSSEGLVFASQKVPEFQAAITFDGGSSAWVVPVPSPSSNDIPEPSTLLSLLIGLGLVSAMQWFRRK